MENSSLLLKDIENFRTCTINLVEKIRKANMTWKDEKYLELFSSIQKLAKDSNQLIEKGEKCKKAITDFEKVVY